MAITWISLEHYGMSFEAFVDNETVGAVVQANQENIKLNSLFQTRLSDIGFEIVDETTSFIDKSVKYGDIKKIFPNATVKSYDTVDEILASEDMHHKIMSSRSTESDNFDALKVNQDVDISNLKYSLENKEDIEKDNIETEIPFLNEKKSMFTFEHFLMRNLVERDVIDNFLQMVPLIESEFSINGLNSAILDSDQSKLNDYVKECVMRVKANSPIEFHKKGMLDCAIPQYLQYMFSKENNIDLPPLNYSNETLQELKKLIGNIVDGQGVNFFDRKMRVTGAAMFFKMIDDFSFVSDFKKRSSDINHGLVDEENYLGSNKEFDIRIGSLSVGQYNTYRYKVVKEIMENDNFKEAVLDIYSKFRTNELDTSIKM